MNIENINKKIEAFIYDELNVKNALNEREKFIELFPADKLLDLTKEEYALGVPESKNNSFCYWLETKLEPLGNIHGATSAKFWVYYGVVKGDAENKWRWTKWTENNFDVIKRELNNLITAGRKKDYEKIAENKLSPMFKGKILSVYFPNDYLPIFSFEHIKYFLKQFEIYDYQRSVEKAKNKLLEVKNQNALMKNWDNNKFMYFLYNQFDVKGKSKKEIDEETPEIVGKELQIIENKNKNYFPKEKKELKNKADKLYKPDYEEVARNRNNIGKAGENAVFEFEKKRLLDEGKIDLANKVKWISQTDDSQGYDIKSFDLEGNEIHIEVKTTKNDTSDSMSFYLTDKELHRLQEDKTCQIYYVFCLNKKNPKVRIVDKEKLLKDFDKLARSVLYKIDCELK